MAKRKKICIFMGEIILDFQKDACKEIVEQTKNRDIDVVLFASYGSYQGSHGRNIFFEMGEKNIIHLPVLSEFDAIIVCSDTFDIYGMDTELFDKIKAEANCPVVSLRSGPQSYPVITADNRNASREITEHFIKEHGFTKLCYMSGPLNLKDGASRYAGFCDAMKEAGLPIKPNTLFEGDYWRDKGPIAVDHFFDCDIEDRPQAIICANDYMALSVVEELQKRGIRVPEDICVCGFDDIPDSRTSTPPLTTIKTTPSDFIDMAFDTIEKMWNGVEVPHFNHIKHEILLRESCGCGVLEDSVNTFDLLKQINYSDNLLRSASRISADYQNSFTLGNALTVANYHFPLLDCSTGYLCLCDEQDESYNSIEENKIYSDNMYLKLIMHKDRNIAATWCDRKFERKDIIPSDVFDNNEPNFLIVFQVHFRSSAYGYLILQPETNEWPNLFTIMYLNTLAYAIESCIMEDQFKEFSEIKQQYLIDPLTNVYNRRGFEKRIQAILTKFDIDKDTFMGIVSVDLDNLKLINDQYGHSEGDFAITSVVESINMCLGPNDFCARTGGDEFVVTLVSKDLTRINKFNDKLMTTIAAKSCEIGKPYVLHASVGSCAPTRIGEVNLYNCMQIADEDMYKNKREYKRSLS